MVVDDSLVARAALTRRLERDGSARVVAQAADGAGALRRLALGGIDVVLLDVEMPGMDGLDTLSRIRLVAPDVVVIMVSSLTRHGAEVTVRALLLGAADYVTKPSADDADRHAFGLVLASKIRALFPRPARRVVRAARESAASSGRSGRPELVAVGSSTGGPSALFKLLAGLGAGLPVPVVVCQHMPAHFTAALASQLDRSGIMPCGEAREGDALLPGRLYLAPGQRHLLVERRGAALHARLSDAEAENFCRPSVDVLLRSAATASGGRALVVMLTGMGHDGLAGTRAIVEAGGAAIAQDEASSAVWGMPGAIAQAGLCRAVLPLDELGACARHLVQGAHPVGSCGTRPKPR